MKKGTIAAVSAAAGAMAGVITTLALPKPQKEDKVFKFKSYYNMLNQWLILKQDGKSLSKYFIDNEYKTIAIYGMGEMGNRLYAELKDTEVEVKYAIDKNPESIYASLSVCDLEDELAKVDAVVVTAVFAFDSIVNELESKLDCPIISLEDVVYEI